MKKELFALLDQKLLLLENAAKILSRSYQTCSKIGIKTSYTFEELDHFEALTNRFARLSDVLIQKTLRLIDEIDLETSGTVRDRIMRGEKKQLLSNAEVFTKIRMLRNDISHKYIPEEILEIFQSVMQYTPELLDAVQRTQEYCKRFIPI